MITPWEDAISFDEDHLAFRHSVRSFSKRFVAPTAEEVDLNDRIQDETMKAFVDAGLTQLSVPTEWGGPGGDLTAICIAREEVARAGSSAMSMLCGQNMTLVLPLLRFGTDVQKKRFLPQLADGAIVSMCLTEAEVGSRPVEMRTYAERDGDWWTIWGDKALISWGKSARFAVVFAQTMCDGLSKGVSAFIVETSSPEFEIVRHNSKLGQRGLPNVDIRLNALRVHADSMLGPEGQGLDTALRMLYVNRPTMGAIALGTAQSAVDVAIAFLELRKQRGRPLTNHQGLRWMIADMATELTTARSLVYEVARQIDSKQSSNLLATMSSMAKLKATEVSIAVTNNALQMLGGAGYLNDYPIQRYLRDVRVGTLYEGTSEIQRNTIARGVLRVSERSA